MTAPDERRMFSATSASRKERDAELSRKLTDSSTKSEGGVTTTSESQTILPPPQSSQSQSSSSQTTPDPTVKNQATEQPCGKCVRVLQELVAGLKQQQQDDAEEPAPLTLLKAIARGGKGHQQHQQQSQSSHTENIKIEETSDGVRLELQVPTTLPNLLRRYSSIMRDQQTQIQREQHKETESSSSSSSSTTTTAALSSSSTKLVAPPLALATSVKDPSGQTATQLQQQSLPSPPPLTIELKCRKCSDQGPESQARAFLMGPQVCTYVF